MKQLQLFLLPFAGGSSVSFKNLVPMIDSRIEPITIEYAGRMTRKGEPYIDNYNCFLQDVADQIKKYRKTELPYSVFGYSLGSVLAYDLLSQKMVDGTLVHAFVCARGSLLRIKQDRDYSDYSEEDFAREILTLGGIDEKIIKNKRFLSIYLKPVRADYIIWGQYVFKEGKIPCNTTAVYCEKDPATDGVHDWSKIVEGEVDYYEMGSNHFFINQYEQRIAEIVNEHLEKYL